MSLPILHTDRHIELPGFMRTAMKETVTVLRSALLIFLILAAPAFAQAAQTPSGLPVPRFVTLKFGEAVGRAGPSEDHPEVWIYRRAGLPMEVIAETEIWRRVRDPHGDVSWMHRRLLDGARGVMALRETPILRQPGPGGEVTAMADGGAILNLGRCEAGWCRVDAGSHAGWIEAANLWGVAPDESG